MLNWTRPPSIRSRADSTSIFQAEELQDVVVFERQQVTRFGLVGQAFFRAFANRNVAGEEIRVDLAAEFADRPTLCDGHFQVEVSLGRRIASSNDLPMVGPRNGKDQVWQFGRMEKSPQRGDFFGLSLRQFELSRQCGDFFVSHRRCR